MATRTRAPKTGQATKQLQPTSFGYRLLPGKSRRYESLITGKTVSYRTFREIATAKGSPKYSNKVKLFEAILARTNDLERARKESGVSGRQFTTYRTSFETDGRSSASPFKKDDKGRWTFRGAQGFTHTFVNVHGTVTRATFSGHNLIVMQDYRSAYREHSQVDMDKWERAHLSGVTDDAGNVHYPETTLAIVASVLRRMGKRLRARFQSEVFYQLKEAA